MQRPDDELVGVYIAARFLGCSPTKVYQLGFNRIIPSVGVNSRGPFTMGYLRRYKLQVEIQNARWNDNQASTALAGSAQRTQLSRQRNDSFQGQEKTERWPDQERTSILNWFASLLAWG